MDLGLFYTTAEILMLAKLRARGCAVTVFAPDELRGTDPRTIENDMVVSGKAKISLEETFARWNHDTV